jgi:beta-mannosidase
MSKRFFSPVLVSGVVKNDSVVVYASNDCLDEKPCRVEWALLNFDGTKVTEGSKQILVDANTSSAIEKIDLSGFIREEPGQTTYRKDSYRKRGNQYLSLKLITGDSVLSSNVVFFVPPKYWNLKEPEILSSQSVENGRIRIDITAQRFAPYVELGIENSYARFTDNYFHLIPGETKTVYVVSSEIPDKEIRGRFFARSLIDTYTEK